MSTSQEAARSVRRSQPAGVGERPDQQLVAKAEAACFTELCCGQVHQAVHQRGAIQRDVRRAALRYSATLVAPQERRGVSVLTRLCLSHREVWDVFCGGQRRRCSRQPGEGERRLTFTPERTAQ